MYSNQSININTAMKTDTETGNDKNTNTASGTRKLTQMPIPILPPALTTTYT